jgi:hypothetical protein
MSDDSPAEDFTTDIGAGVHDALSKVVLPKNVPLAQVRDNETEEHCLSNATLLAE